MPAQSTYSFRARNASGEIVSGTLVAESSTEVASRLRAEGKIVLSIHDRPMLADVEVDVQAVRRSEAARGVRREDVIALCQQLSVMLETGVPLDEAIESFKRQATRRELRTVLDELSETVCSGVPLSTALARWPRVFPRIMISLTRASEASGTMGMMLGRIGDYLAKERRTVRQVRAALAYPIVMMCIAAVLSVFLVLVILPRFAAIYESRAAQLPGPTRVLLAISDFLTQQWAYWVPGLAVVLIAFFLFRRTGAGRRTGDWLRLHIPVLRTMYAQLYVTRAARTMATLFGAGVNLLDIIDICRGVTNNVCFNELWDRMERAVRNGENISDAARRSKYMPPSVTSMISSGERSGRLEQVMGRIADFAEEELDASVRSVTSYIEPAMIVVMGVLVGGVALALLLPIFRMGNVMAG